MHWLIGLHVSNNQCKIFQLQICVRIYGFRQFCWFYTVSVRMRYYLLWNHSEFLMSLSVKHILAKSWFLWLYSKQRSQISVCTIYMSWINMCWNLLTLLKNIHIGVSINQTIKMHAQVFCIFRNAYIYCLGLTIGDTHIRFHFWQVITYIYNVMMRNKISL